jgi:rhodanese-related sulfurtransferase
MTKSNVPEIDVHEAKKRIEAGALLLDVREKSEFIEAHIAASQLLPLSEFTERFEAELPQARDIVVYCRSGRRSAQAAEFLLERGYRAVNMAGGILAWREAELPVEEGSEN